MTKTPSPLLLSIALFFAGLGAAGQFAKVGVIFDFVSAAYMGASVTWLGLLVSGVGMVGLVSRPQLEAGPGRPSEARLAKLVSLHLHG